MRTLFLMDNDGGYFAFGEKPESKYFGNYFWCGDEFIRVVEEIMPCGMETAEALAKRGKWGIRTWDDTTEDAFWYHRNSLCCVFSGERPRELFLDVKKSYDNRSFGRFFEVSEENGCVFVHYRKQHEAAESDQFGKYEVHLAIAAENGKVEFTQNWTRRFYEFDAKREGNGERYVYSLLKTGATRLVVSFGETKAKAAAELEKNRDFLRAHPQFPRKSAKKDFAAAATEALSGLVCHQYGRDGILAGFPWFFQYWTRDEAISAKALTLIGKTAVAKQILLKLIDNIDDEGRIPNRIPAADLGCADGVGWVFLRLKEMYQNGQLNAAETKKVKKALQTSLEQIERHFEVGGLIENRRLETWMDTDWNGDDRSGARIEIQALILAMREFLTLLMNKSSITSKLRAHEVQTITDFWNGEWLNDGKGDNTIRPNIFIANYAYPRLLSKADWEKCFDAAIKALWLPWGGFASIDTAHPLFCPEYSGQNNRSYHRGDSWYFLNFLAGICLARLNKKKYEPQILQILAAAKKDVNELGAIGCVSEISSAKTQSAFGCLNQAWSNAMLIELLEEVEIGDRR